MYCLLLQPLCIHIFLQIGSVLKDNPAFVFYIQSIPILQILTSRLAKFGSPVFKVARQAGQWYILVARLENAIALGRRASDFVSPDFHYNPTTFTILLQTLLQLAFCFSVKQLHFSLVSCKSSSLFWSQSLLLAHIKSYWHSHKSVFGIETVFNRCDSQTVLILAITVYPCQPCEYHK